MAASVTQATIRLCEFREGKYLFSLLLQVFQQPAETMLMRDPVSSILQISSGKKTSFSKTYRLSALAISSLDSTALVGIAKTMGILRGGRGQVAESVSIIETGE